MGAFEDTGRSTCQGCRSDGPTVRERGRLGPVAVLCDPCWNVRANALAEEEGATAPPRAEPGPDDTAFHEPPLCPDCGALVEHRPTDYDRWVRLATGDLPAVDVPPRHRWRLVTVRTRGSGAPVDVVAVRIHGVEPLPGELVRPAHRAVCPGREAGTDETEEAGEGGEEGSARDDGPQVVQ